MEITLLSQGALNGVMLGLNYALIALGLSLIFGIMGIVNFAHGEMYMLGGYVAYFMIGQYGLDFFSAIIGAVIITGLLGMFFEKTIFRPLTTRPKEALTTLIAAVGLAWVLQMLAMVSFGDLDRNVPSTFHGIINMGGVVITKERLVTIIVALGLVALLNFFLLRTRLGSAIRAVAQDKEAAALQGIRVTRISALAFGIGCALAGSAGALMAPIFFISPFLGGEVILKAFLVVILGGMGSIPGALLGGLVLGFIESFGSLFFTVPTVSAITFILIIFVLIIKPQGLLSHE